MSVKIVQWIAVAVTRVVGDNLGGTPEALMNTPAATMQQLCTRHGTEKIEFTRGEAGPALLTQHAAPHKRPFIHPILAPDGVGVLTEDAPPHHPWQHGLYVGLNDVNGVGFWGEGLTGNPKDGTFHPAPLAPARLDGSTAQWDVVTEWRAPDGAPLLTETQAWSFTDCGTAYNLDLAWTLRAAVDLTFGKYAYGGLFLRMPFRAAGGGMALNSGGLSGPGAEGQRARWVAVAMPIAGRADSAGMAIFDHPSNVEHPVPWRVDGQLGIAPSHCIAGSWRLARGSASQNRYRVRVYCGGIVPAALDAQWKAFATS